MNQDHSFFVRLPRQAPSKYELGWPTWNEVDFCSMFHKCSTNDLLADNLLLSPALLVSNSPVMSAEAESRDFFAEQAPIFTFFSSFVHFVPTRAKRKVKKVPGQNRERGRVLNFVDRGVHPINQEDRIVIIRFAGDSLETQFRGKLRHLWSGKGILTRFQPTFWCPLLAKSLKSTQNERWTVIGLY